jgi:hypothetical protein
MKHAPTQRFDRLLAPKATAEETACHTLCSAFDRAARAADLKWGIDRLTGLVSTETAQKWAAVLGRLNDALNANDVPAVQREVGIAVRGFAAMDAEATRLGHAPMPPAIWQLEVGGVVCAILQDFDQWPAAQAALPGVRLYSLQEVAIALEAYGQTVAAVKDAFPGATVQRARPKTELEESLNDEIPF